MPDIVDSEEKIYFGIRGANGSLATSQSKKIHNRISSSIYYYYHYHQLKKKNK